MVSRSLSLSPRKEDIREKQIKAPVVEFELREILGHYKEAIADIQRQFGIADRLVSEGMPEDAQNIWRSQIVFIEAALDFFIHEISQYGVIKMFTGDWERTSPYNRMLIPMEQVEKGIKNAESNDWFVGFINSKFSRDVYLGYEPMKDQINLIGINFGECLDEAFPKTKDEEDYRNGKTIVMELYSRRNQIAHQLDKMHSNALQQEITKSYVEQAISDVDNIVNAIYNKAIKK